MSGLRLHPRTQVVAKARAAVAGAMLAIAKTYDLTYAEEAQILAGAIENCMKYAIRAERHPDDPEKRGDEA